MKTVQAPTYFVEELESHLGKKVHLRINDNRSTMISVRWESKCTRVSLHRMFLEAPEEVKMDLMDYLKSKRKKMAPGLRTFMSDKIETIDYSHELDTSELETNGKFYDLNEIYKEVNKEYFDSRLDLRVTWFGERRPRTRSKVTFGLYVDPLKLIKIHRRLDDPKYPDFFVSFIMYHEMLHHICRPYVDEKGTQRIHTQEFKAQEKQFRQYKMAKQWLSLHKEALFNNKWRGIYGWS